MSASSLHRESTDSLIHMSLHHQSGPATCSFGKIKVTSLAYSQTHLQVNLNLKLLYMCISVYSDMCTVQLALGTAFMLG